MTDGGDDGDGDASAAAGDGDGSPPVKHCTSGMSPLYDCSEQPSHVISDHVETLMSAGCCAQSLTWVCNVEGVARTRKKRGTFAMHYLCLEVCDHRPCVSQGQLISTHTGYAGCRRVHWMDEGEEHTQWSPRWHLANCKKTRATRNPGGAFIGI